MTVIKVEFKEGFPEKMVKDLCESEFMGLCAKTQRTGESKVVILLPTPHEHRTLKLQLEELEREGALSFSEV
jgi:hypothetical protein